MWLVNEVGAKHVWLVDSGNAHGSSSDRCSPNRSPDPSKSEYLFQGLSSKSVSCCVVSCDEASNNNTNTNDTTEQTTDNSSLQQS